MSFAIVQLSSSIFCDTAPHHWVIWCSVLQDSFTVPSSGTFDPGRWYHLADHKLWALITQRCNLVSRKNVELKISCLCHMRFSSCYCICVLFSCVHYKPYPSSQLLSFNCTNRIRRSLIMMFAVIWFVSAIIAAPVRVLKC